MHSLKSITLEFLVTWLLYNLTTIAEPKTPT